MSRIRSDIVLQRIEIEDEARSLDVGFVHSNGRGNIQTDLEATPVLSRFHNGSKGGTFSVILVRQQPSFPGDQSSIS